MNKRKLGNSGLETFPLALGGNVFGWTADEPTSFALLDAFVEAGFSLVDTADVYSVWVPGHTGGESETAIGKWLKRSGKRQDVMIATKSGMEMSPEKKGLSRDHILRSVEDSLKRLQTDYIDLYQAHIDDETTPLDETLEALDQTAGQLDSTPARVALAWLIARPSITAPIASATNLAQLNDLIEATRLELDLSSIELLNEAGSLGAQASLPA